MCSCDSSPAIAAMRAAAGVGLDLAARTTKATRGSAGRERPDWISPLRRLRRLMIVIPRPLLTALRTPPKLGHSGPIGQPSFFQHQVRHYDSRITAEITDRLGALGRNVPVQIIRGESDEWQPVAYGHKLAADIPGATLHVIPEAGHFPMEDKPDVVADLVIGHIGASAARLTTGAGRGPPPAGARRRRPAQRAVGRGT